MNNTNIKEFRPLIKPNVLSDMLPASNNVIKLVEDTRKEIQDILAGKSTKKLFIVGPCSIHNVEDALEYGKELKKIAYKVRKNILVVMRVYFEKPRTTVGWKGLINDPDINDSFNVNKGLMMARKLLLELNEIGLPCGYEVLDTITPQYISDLISWGAIGARTTESQVHRQMVSGLSMPVGFKNGTDGNKIIARDAIISAGYPHCFMGINDEGTPSICTTKGNKHCHIILRGGKEKSNYSFEDLEEMTLLLIEKNIYPSIMVDCSHGNSKKNYKNQKKVLKSVLNSMKKIGNIFGVMIESNINEGKQYLCEKKNLKKGISITDSCIGLIETQELLLDANHYLTNMVQYTSIDIII